MVIHIRAVNGTNVHDLPSRTTRLHRDVKRDGQAWLDEETAKILAGTWVDPRTSKMTMGEWLDKWTVGYSVNKNRTVTQAGVHVKLIRAKFGTRQLRTIRPSDVKEWTAEL